MSSIPSGYHYISKRKGLKTSEIMHIYGGVYTVMQLVWFYRNYKTWPSFKTYQSGMATTNMIANILGVYGTVEFLGLTYGPQLDELLEKDEVLYIGDEGVEHSNMSNAVKVNGIRGLMLLTAVTVIPAIDIVVDEAFARTRIPQADRDSIAYKNTKDNMIYSSILNVLINLVGGLALENGTGNVVDTAVIN